MVRGASAKEDVAELAAVSHLLMIEFGMHVWFEWIDSDSNPADGLSRDGLEDVWTRAQRWSLAEAPILDDFHVSH